MNPNYLSNILKNFAENNIIAMALPTFSMTLQLTSSYFLRKFDPFTTNGALISSIKEHPTQVGQQNF